MQDNPLLVCADEISRIKKNFVQEQDDFKVKQKAGVVTYKMMCKKWEFYLFFKKYFYGDFIWLPLNVLYNLSL